MTYQSSSVKINLPIDEIWIRWVLMEESTANIESIESNNIESMQPVVIHYKQQKERLIKNS